MVGRNVESRYLVAKILVDCFSVSLDGFGAGPDQSEVNPLGIGGGQLHEWIFATKSGRRMIGESGGESGIDDDVFHRSFEEDGPVIMGRNMFGPIRGPWGDSDWRGWWGEEPPFHGPVFVMTHHERPDLVMGETTFYFVTDGIDEAIRRAGEVAGTNDIHVGGGVSTIRMLLDAQRIDEMWLDVVPVHLGAGERLFKTLDDWPAGYRREREVKGERATHLQLVRIEAP
jgi:dihydrofolate reductase